MKQGIIKLIPVTEVTEGMKLYIEEENQFGYKIVNIKANSLGISNYKDNDETISWAKREISKLKTLVIEYDFPDEKIQFLINYPDWQYILDNNLIGKEVEFEMAVAITSFIIPQFAKIIKQDKQENWEKIYQEYKDFLNKVGYYPNGIMKWLEENYNPAIKKK